MTRETILERAPLETPIGTLVALVTPAASGQGPSLRALFFEEQEPALAARLASRIGPFQTRPSKPGRLLEPVRRYLDGDLEALDRVETLLDGTPFQLRVWRELRRIPAGSTISYADLAGRVGRPEAHRAVAAANGANPVAVVVSCHRVVSKEGLLWGYGGGLARKAWLLRHEGVRVDGDGERAAISRP